jgi:ABC-type transporter Mla subunit MlaD
MRRLQAAWHRRLDWVPGEHRTRPLRNGIITLSIGGLLLFWGFTHHLPFAGGGDGRVVRAQFASANQVNSRTPVRMGGVDVGQVERVEPGLGRRGSTVVMRITRGGLDLHRDAGAQIRWRTLLGGSMYIDLTPGSSSSSPLGSQEISANKTGSQVDWDYFNAQFSGNTRQQQRRMFSGLRKTFAAPGGVRRTIRALAPTLSVIGSGTDALRGQQRGDLPRLVRATGRTLRALSLDSGTLEGFVSGADRTLAVTAGHRVALGEAIALSPPALQSTTLTMNRVVSTLDRLDPLVARLRPGARRLAPAARALRPGLDAAERLLRHARPLLRTAPTVLRNLAAMSRQGVPLVHGLDPTVIRLRDQLLPFLDRTDTETGLRNYQAIGPFFSTLDGGASEFDGSGYFLHFMTGGAPDSLLLPCDNGLDPTQTSRCNVVNEVLKNIFGP